MFLEKWVGVSWCPHAFKYLVKNLNSTRHNTISFRLKSILSVENASLEGSCALGGCVGPLCSTLITCVSTASLCFQLYYQIPFIQALAHTQFNSHAHSCFPHLSGSPSFFPLLLGDTLCSAVLGNHFQWTVSIKMPYFLVLNARRTGSFLTEAK